MPNVACQNCEGTGWNPLPGVDFCELCGGKGNYPEDARSERLPRGTYTKNTEYYIYAWKCVGNSVAALFGPDAQLYGFDPTISLLVEGNVVQLGMREVDRLLEHARLKPPGDVKYEDLLEALEDCVNQSCRTQDGKIDSCSISSFAGAMRLLQKAGRLVEVEVDAGRRVIGKWASEAVQRVPT